MSDSTAHPVQHQKWLAKNKEARAQIALTLKDKLLNGILYVPIAKDVWKSSVSVTRVEESKLLLNSLVNCFGVP
jgi:hypothetical protein